MYTPLISLNNQSAQKNRKEFDEADVSTRCSTHLALLERRGNQAYPTGVSSLCSLRDAALPDDVTFGRSQLTWKNVNTRWWRSCSWVGSAILTYKRTARHMSQLLPDWTRMSHVEQLATDLFVEVGCGGVVRDGARAACREDVVTM